jgi:hypothetical protein
LIFLVKLLIDVEGLDQCQIKKCMAAIRAPAPALDIFGLLFGNPLKCLVSQFQQRFITLEVGRKVKIHLFTPLIFFIPQIQLRGHFSVWGVFVPRCGRPCWGAVGRTVHD